MKRFFFSVFISVLLFVISSNAQTFEKIKVGEVWQEAIDGNKGILTNSKFILLQTVNGFVNIGGFPVNVSFDINTGASEAWAFISVDSVDTTHFATTFVFKNSNYGLMFMTREEFNLNLSGKMSEYKAIPEDYVLDSDSLAEALRANQEFMDFYNKNYPFDYLGIDLFVNSNFEDINYGEPYWMLNIRTQENWRTCSVHGITKEIYCVGDDTYVDDNLFLNLDDYLIFPNPASEMVYMNLPEPISNLRIMNIFGETIKEFSTAEINNFNSNQKFSFGTGEFATGIYFVIIDNRISKKFVIER